MLLPGVHAIDHPRIREVLEVAPKPPKVDPPRVIASLGLRLHVASLAMQPQNTTNGGFAYIEELGGLLVRPALL